MSYINNFSPRRMVWFNQHEPKNKMDLWLSYNSHYTEDEETSLETGTTDNPSQRKCDLILKAWDCGKWVPIVGFNSTAANKIDTVEGNRLYNPAIFTGENPNDLYDAGTLGSLLSDTNFVSEQEWHDVFNSSNYNWGDIFSDTNWFNTLVWQEILNGSNVFHLPFATTTVCGGIFSDTHTYGAASAFKPIEIKFYPTTNAYTSKRNRLCVSASEVIEQINDYYNENPSGSTLSIPLATYENIGGARILTDTTDQDYRGVPVLFGGPNAGLIYGGNTPSGFTLYGDSSTYNSDNSFLYIPAWALLDVLLNPTGEDTPEPMIRNGLGTYAKWHTDSHSGLEYCTVSLQCTPNVDKGKYLRLNASGTDIEWVTIESGNDTWRPIQVNGSGIPSGNTFNIIGTGNTSVTQSTSSGVTTVIINSSENTNTWRPVEINGSGIPSGNSLSFISGDNVSFVTEDASGVTKFTINASGGTISTYTEGAGIDISTGNTISQEISSVNIDTAPNALNVTYTASRDKIQITGSGYTKEVSTYLVYSNDQQTDYTFSLVSNGSMFYNTNPIYMKINSKSVTMTNDTDFICCEETASGNTIPGGFYLVTLQFGVLKFEKIRTYTNSIES